MKKKSRFETKTIHSGEKPDSITGAIIPPIYQTATFIQKGPGVNKGYDYSRTGNPTRTILEEKLAALELGKYGLCFASGMAAINNVLVLLNSGDHVVSESNVYGGTYRLFTKLYSKYNINFSFIDCINLKNVDRAFQKNSKLLWIETPTNPLLKIIDIEEIAKIAHEHNTPLVVDNTFATPYLQQPLLLGADIIVYSTTKYLGGHSDVVGGAVITSNKRIYNELAFFQNAIGAIPGPFDSWLVSRSIKTLSLRMKQHCENAREIAKFLNNHPKVETVNYPGLPNHPQHSLAKKQMKDFGGIISFELEGDVDTAKKFLRSLKIFSLAVSLGAVESLVAHPATMTHVNISKEDRMKAGLSDRLIRLSVGLENVDDLIEDLNTGLKKI